MNNEKLKAKLTVVALVLLTLRAAAATYYVDPVLGNDANPGTQLLPWASVPGAVGTSGAGWVVLQGGDTLYVRGGSANNYQVLFDSNYYNPADSLDSVQIRSGDVIGWGSGRASFDGQNTRAYGLALGIRGIRVNRLEIRNIAPGSPRGPGQPGVIWGLCSAGIEVGSTVTKPTFLHIDDCYIHNIYRSGSGEQGHGIECYGPDAQYEASLCVFEHNIIGDGTSRNIGQKGIEFYGTKNVIRANFISGTWDHGIVDSGNHNDICGNVVFMVPPYGYEPVFGIKINFSYNDVWNNITYQPAQTIPSSTANMQGIGTLDSGSSNRFYFNTCINSTDLNHNRTGAGLSIADENAPESYNDYENNIVAFCTNNLGGGWPGVQVYIGTGATHCTMKYCDLYCPGATKVVAYNSGSGYNFYTAAEAVNGTPGGNTFQNLLQADPVFRGGNLPTGLDSNYHPNTTYFKPTFATLPPILTTGNKLLGDGTHGCSSDPNKFNTDILGVKRTGWSMGAYEMSPSVLPAPTGLRVVPGP